jgi:hypothetical protein
MSIEINFKKRFVVNGREYSSAEDMPEDLRQAFKDLKTNPAVNINASAKIVFNGREYSSVDEMPEDQKEFYERVVNTALRGEMPKDGLDNFLKGLSMPKASHPASRPIEPESSISIKFTPQTLLMAIMALVALAAIYLLA